MRARRVDANLSEIVHAYRALGARVHVTNGDWDLTVQYGGLTDLIEVKDGAKPPSARKLTRREAHTHEQLMIRVVETIEHVSEHVAAMRKKQFALMAHPSSTP